MNSVGFASVAGSVRSMVGGWGPWAAVVALAAWAHAPAPSLLVLAGVGVTASLWNIRGRGPLWGAGVVTLLVGMTGGFRAHERVVRVQADWTSYWEEREATIGARLAELLDNTLRSVEEAADGLSALTLAAPGRPTAEQVAEIRRVHNVDALALYEPSGRLAVWDGVHWGRVPEGVRGGFLRHTYRDRPLFGYLYVTALMEDGRVAVAADLLRADLPEVLEVGMGDFQRVFERSVGERVTVSQHDPPGGQPVWDLALPDRRLASVVVHRPTAEARALEILDRWRGRVALVVLLGWLLLALGRPGNVRWGAGALPGTLALVGVAAALPFDALGSWLASLWGGGGPGGSSGDGTAAVRWAWIGLAAVAVAAALPRPRLPYVHPAVRGALAGAAFWGVVAAFEAFGGTLTEPLGRWEWVAAQVSLAVALSGVVGVALTGARTGRPAPWCRWAGLALAAVLASVAGAMVWWRVDVPSGWWLLWGVPVGCLAAAGTESSGPRGGGEGRHILDGRRPRTVWLVWIVAATASIPAAWEAQIAVRLSVAEERLRGLASSEDPELAEALGRVAAVVDSLDAQDREDIDVLYRAWLESGLAGSGRPVRLTRWLPDGFRGVEIQAGTEALLPGVLPTLLQEQRRDPSPRLLHLDRDDARYVLTVPLRDGGVVSAVAPPFSTSSRPSSLDAFARGTERTRRQSLSVTQLLPGDPAAARPIRRSKEPDGWSVAAGVRFANGRAYHVRQDVPMPDLLLAVARAVLLVLCDVVALGAFWVVGRWLLGWRRSGRPGRGGAVPSSFRARLTVALFGFFGLATALLGSVAYRGLAEASYRSAEVIAEGVVDDAAVWYRTLAGGMQRLTRQVGADLVVYDSGGLLEGSVPELVELGLYPGWTPFDVHAAMSELTASELTTEFRLGQWAYIAAFRRMTGGEVLASQVPLRAGTQAVRASDLLEVLGFVVVLGGGLSLLLAVGVGRALARPLEALAVASERVGAGGTSVRLPEDRTDEFGAVFRAFNRMVERIRRSRRQLVATSRRTRLIMEEAAVGMLAVDATGRVTLLNPRAAELLGEGARVGHGVDGEDGLAAELGAWLRAFLEHGAEQADDVVPHDDRRIRVRARRLGRDPERVGEGAVVALDDVTDELRVERILAWGEMARQVAHEVKNPLTPIKLSIQHVRRAWRDDREDFEDILFRNAEAMLREIDRLAGIAQGFARFGAPDSDAGPLEQVDVAAVVAEVLELYGSSVSSVRFRGRVDRELPPVVARAAEMKEALLNLLENARSASEAGQVVTVSAHREGSDVHLAVEDRGSGIPPEVLPRIFEPRFSARTGGSGLGLAIVQRLVRGWGASIEVQSAVGDGSVFTIALRPWEET